MLVTMTHTDLPGVEVVVEQISYRYGYYPKGWRSLDDPSWEGAGATATQPHAADDTIHGAGQLLGRAFRTSDSATTTSSTPVAVPDLSISFTRPARSYEVRMQGRFLIADSGAIGTMAMFAQIGVGTAVIVGSDGHHAPAANSMKNMAFTLPVPGPAVTSPNTPDWHKPAVGDLVTYSVYINRSAGTGNVSLSVDNPLLGKCPTFIEAVTV